LFSFYDPTFSPPGEYAGGLVKTTGPAVPAGAVGRIDLVLLSHDHHSDNLDPAGRESLALAGTVPKEFFRRVLELDAAAFPEKCADAVFDKFIQSLLCSNFCGASCEGVRSV